jgi:hypothetical protein
MVYKYATINSLKNYCSSWKLHERTNYWQGSDFVVALIFLKWF